MYLIERLLVEDDYDCEWLLRNKQENRCNRLLREFIDTTTKQLQSLNSNKNNYSNSKSYWSNK
jgi:hypothetical protein